MVSLQTIALSLALIGGGGGSDIVLLDFTAEWCKPCNMMAPVVQRLEDEGFPVQRINIDQQPQLAQKLKVESIPCFVLLQNGQEVDRITGAASYDLLVRLFDRNGYRAASAATVRGQSPDDETSEGAAWQQAVNTTNGDTEAIAPRDSQTSFEMVPNVEQRALASSVRLRIEEPQGNAFGTGTIIDVHGEEALIVTCGHLFRDSKGNGAISIELLAPGASGSVPGQLITYDAEDHDIALVAFRPGVPVAVAPIASSVDGIQQGASVFSVGCDHGGAASIIKSRIAAIDKYVGRRKYSHNIEVAGQPVDGRSGGGLFDVHGRLIGICNAADPADNEGIYAGLKTIHSHLDEINLSRIYQSPATDSQVVANEQQVVQPVSFGTQAVSGQREALEHSQETPNLLAALNSGMEVICIVRGPNQKDEVLVLDRASREMLGQYMRERSLAANVASLPDEPATIRAQNGK